MQCLWYECEMGRSYARQGFYGRALRYFLESLQHFYDMNDDQFDFHNYCLRKNGIPTYVTMLKMQDRIFSNKFYKKAVKDACKIFVILLEKNKEKVLSGGDGANGGGNG